MTKPVNIPESLIPALKLFMTELDTHVGYFHNNLENVFSSQNRSSEDEEATLIHHKFHTIKGGAGFFQLNDIRESAAKGEKLLEQAIPIETDDKLRLQSELQKIVDILDDELLLIKEILNNSAF